MSVPKPRLTSRQIQMRNAHKQFYITRSSLNYELQREQCAQINIENKKLALALINQKPSINFEKFEQENTQRANLKRSLSKFKNKSPIQLKTKVGSAYSPAINKGNFKDNFYLKKQHKDLNKSYGKLNFNGLNQNTIDSRDNSLTINQRNGMAVEKSDVMNFVLPPGKFIRRLN